MPGPRIEMVFNYDDTSFSYQFHVNGRHLVCGDQLAPFAGENFYESVPAKALLSDVENDSSSYHKEFINVTADLYDNLRSDLSDNPTLAWMTGNTSEVILSDNGKRSLSDYESSLQVGKRLKQIDHHLQSISPEEIHSGASKPPSPGSIEDLEDSAVDTIADEFASEAKSSHLFAQNTSHENDLDSPTRLTLHSNFSGNRCQASECNHDNEIFSPTFCEFNWKRVPVGANHHADIPEWRPREFDNQLRNSETSCNYRGTDCHKWLGTHLMPMPDCALLASEVVALPHVLDCSCSDDGSIRCVRQHVTRAREMVKQDLGQERFSELGFNNMGEVVAQKWTEEEEQLFHEIVSSYPVSLGQNFWNKLPQYFPSKSSKDLVSYYFNVFMLRKRAVQNRLDPLHIDSDDDELQESESGEYATDDDDVDSAVDSLVEGVDDGSGQDELNEMEITEETDDAEDHHYDKLTGYKGDMKEFIHTKSNLVSSAADHNIQDDSCTSFESQHNATNSCDPTDNFALPHGSFDNHLFLLHKDDLKDGPFGLTYDEFSGGHCDLDTWDMSYSCGTKTDGFLSSFNVIKEVFREMPSEK
ncbi:hypothetical protein ZIOFF_064645 [Zingiber officinale]|uniref:Myb-like domain-containing protein n=2 Tax=Zingiber officinale TaxID=94328 RepID=A0A8J5K8E6_ZINOF|nr:hypothetical protein ZIOFF_064645 [Zingiber officinale]